MSVADELVLKMATRMLMLMLLRMSIMSMLVWGCSFYLCRRRHPERKPRQSVKFVRSLVVVASDQNLRLPKPVSNTAQEHGHNDHNQPSLLPSLSLSLPSPQVNTRHDTKSSILPHVIVMWVHSHERVEAEVGMRNRGIGERLNGTNTRLHIADATGSLIVYTGP